MWKAILTDAPSFKGGTWAEISDAAKSFVSSLLSKDPAARPTAAAALAHPWLAGDVGDRATGRPLRGSVVQRLQRFGATHPLKRTIFELIAAELLRMAPSPSESPGSSMHGAKDGGGGAGGSVRAGAAATAPSRPPRDMQRAVSSGNLLRALRAEGGDGGGGGGRGAHPPPAGHRVAGVQSVHGGADYWRLLRAAAAASRLGARAAAGAGAGGDGSARGGAEYLRTAPRGARERNEARKVARLALDTSKHGGAEYARLVAACEGSAHGGGSVRAGGGSLRAGELFHKAPGSGRLVEGEGGGAPAAPAATAAALPSWAAAPPPPAASPPPPTPAAESRGRALGAYAAFLAGGGVAGTPPSAMQVDEAERGGAGVAHPTPLSPPSARRPGSLDAGGAPRRVTFGGDAAVPMEEEDESPRAPPLDAAEDAAEAVSFAELRDVMRKMHFTRGQEAVTEDALADGLARLGYRLAPGEGRLLAEQVSSGVHPLDRAPGAGPAAVTRPAFVASQVDWAALATNHRDAWLAAAARVFGDLAGSDPASPSPSTLPTAALVAALRDKLPAAEVEHAVEDALLDAGAADAEGVDFEGFLRLLAAGAGAGAGAGADLDAFDARRPSVDGSRHGGGRGLAAVEEEGGGGGAR